MTEQEVRVLRVARAQGTGRGDPQRCDLEMQLSRPVDFFEEEALMKHLGVTVDGQDKMLAYWRGANLVEFAKNPGALNGKLMNAAGLGHPAREEAKQRDARIDQLVKDINAGLQQ